MKRITAILLLISVLLCGCGEGATTSGDGNEKPNTSCTLSDCEEGNSVTEETSNSAISLDAKSGQEAIENAMKAVKALDQESVSHYLGADFWEWSLAAGDENKFELVKGAFPYLTYEVIGFEVVDDFTVNGTVKIKCLDMGYLFLDTMARLNDWSEAMAVADLAVTDEGWQSELYRIFKSELEDPASFRYCESEITLEAYNFGEGEPWRIGRSDEFVRALFGTVTWGYGMG